MDLIDKKPLIRHLVNWQMEQFVGVGHEREYNMLDKIIRGIENEPTIEAVPVVHGWIPCSERLPNCSGVYQVTKEFLTGDRVVDCAYFDGQNTWHNDNRVNHGRAYLKNVIAWMPLPEPYTEQT